jgi:hypothetical protein
MRLAVVGALAPVAFLRHGSNADRRGEPGDREQLL